MVRNTGIPVSIRVVLPLENISMNRAGKALKSTPRPVMKMTAYRMHFQMVMRAISAFRAPRYCPTSVEARHADGEAGQEAERFNADGNIVDAQHAFNRQFADDGKAEHLDAPHAEDFHTAAARFSGCASACPCPAVDGKS